MVMVLIRAQALVANDSIPKIAAANQPCNFERFETAIDRYRVAEPVGNALHNLLDSKGTMVLEQELEHRNTGSRPLERGSLQQLDASLLHL